MNSAYISREAGMTDLPAMKRLFEQSIRSTCANDYSPSEIEAWLLSLRNEERWQKLIQQQWVLILESDQDLLGFGSLKGADYLDFLYVSPHFQKKGAARQILSLIERKAMELEAETLSSDISITARPFMEKQGYRVIRENRNQRGNEVLINYRMEKLLKKNPDSLRG